MMSDQDLERRLAELRDIWRVAGEPPLDGMWERVEAKAFAPRQLGKLCATAPDRRAKEAAINGLLKRGDRQSVDMLLGIPRTETDQTVRRGLVSRLGRLEDARVKEFLKDLVNR